mmetsp:Transcript_12898/g.24319  ORF Transcript_12898/g.24319 Transcript_12898/m.24319 type:complete len:256 (+) Transcript_12898:1383-2150(+)
MRERKVRQNPRRISCQRSRLRLPCHGGNRDSRIVVDHYRFGVAGRARGVDDPHRVTGTRGLLPRLEALIALRGTQLQAFLKSQHAANASIFPGDLWRRRHPPANNGPELGEILDVLHSRVELHLSINHHDGSVGVVNFVLHLLRSVRGVDAHVLATAQHRSQCAYHPLRGIETEDGDATELFHAKLNERLGQAAGILPVGFPRPLRPCLPGQRRCLAGLHGRRQGLLGGQGRDLWEILGSLLQERREERRRRFLG